MNLTVAAILHNLPSYEFTVRERFLQKLETANEPAFIRADLHSSVANQHYLQLNRMFNTALVSASISQYVQPVTYMKDE